MSDLTSDSTIQYGDVVFGPTSKIVGLESVPNYDSARRVVVSTTYRITIHGYVEAAQNLEEPVLNQSMSILRARLTQSAQRLTIANAGFGAFTIQVNRQDVRWGPLPQVIAWANTGHNLVWEVTWKVEVCVAGECLDGTRALSGQNGPLEFCYSVNWSLDRSRYTRRTYSGHVRIPAIRRSATSTLLPDQADRMREKVIPGQPFGFVRDVDTYDLSEDKAELRFTVVDVEQPPNVLPTGCINVEASEEIHATGIGLRTWSCTLSATYEPAKGISPAECAAHFGRLAKDRIEGVVRNQIVNVAPNGDVRRAVAIILGYRMGEPEIYGRRAAAFTVNWQTICHPLDAVQATGLWRPVPSASWDAWNQSLSFRSDPRGNARMAFKGEEDALINLCLNRGQEVTKPSPVLPVNRQAVPPTNPAPKNLMRILSDAFSTERPERDSSWLDYKLRLRVEVTQDKAAMRLLPPSSTIDFPGSSDIDAIDGYKVLTQPASVPTWIVQRRGAPRIELVLDGYAVRVGYEVTPPALLKVGGLTPEPWDDASRGDGFMTEIVPDLQQPVVVAQWQFRYLLTGIPTGTLSSPKNPLYGAVSRGGGSLGGFFVSQ